MKTDFNYDVEHVPEDPFLIGRLATEKKTKIAVDNVVTAAVVEEATSVYKQAQSLIAKANAIEQNINQLIGAIDKEADAAQLNFKLDAKAKKSVRTAMKAALGVRGGTITYAMYKAALEARAALETQDKNFLFGE